MKTQSRRRLASATGVALAGTLALAGCGSDSNPTAAPAANGASAANCAKGTLNGEGSSAQKNAIEEAIRGFQDSCAGANVNWIIVDGFGQTGNGNYALTYSVQ